MRRQGKRPGRPPGKPPGKSPALDTEPRERGSALSEYLVVMAGLLIVYTGIDIVIDLLEQHTERYGNVLELLF